MSIQAFVEETLEKIKNEYPIETLIGNAQTIGVWVDGSDPDVSSHSENEEGFNSDEVRALLEPKLRLLFPGLNFSCRTFPDAIEFYFNN